MTITVCLDKLTNSYSGIVAISGAKSLSHLEAETLHAVEVTDA